MATPREQTGVFVVIPAFNEGEAIGSVVAEAASYCERVIVVDDASRDETGLRAAEAGALVARHALNRGQGASLKTGIDLALRLGAQIIVTVDADGQHDPAEIPALVGPVERGDVEVTLGSRFLDQVPRGLPPVRRWLLQAGVVFTRLVSGLSITDTHNGFRAFSRSAAQRIEIRQDRMAHASEILDEIARHGLRFREVPVTIRYSDYSLAKGQRSSNAFGIAATVLYEKLLR
jgi:glycosyltransferase involved in cell wall biosynthesis